MTEEGPKATETPDPTPKGAEGAEGAASDVDLSAKISLQDGQTTTVGDLIQKAQEADHLRQYREAASQMMQASTTLTPEREKAIRFVMREENWTDQDIDDYIYFLRQEPDTADSPEPQEPAMPNTSSNVGEKETPHDAKIRELEERLARAEQRVGSHNIDLLRQKLDEAVGAQLDQHEGVKLLLKRSKDLLGQDDYDKRVAVFQEEVRERLLSRVRQRKAAGGQFDASWFRDEAPAAADAAVGFLRAAIGDPDKLQRVPETDSGTLEFRKVEPPSDPKWEPGDQGAQVIKKATDFAEGTLRHLAQEMEMGGKTQV